MAYNYYKARFYVQTVARARRDGVHTERHYGYLVRLDPPASPNESACGGKAMAWCKTKSVAESAAQGYRDSQRKGYFACPCGSGKQARLCCGVPRLEVSHGS